MIEILQFVFQDFFTFAGTVIIISIIGSIVTTSCAAIAAAIFERKEKQ